MIARTFEQGMEAYMSGPATQCASMEALRGYEAAAQMANLSGPDVPAWVNETICNALDKMERQEFDFSSYAIDDVQPSMADEPGYTEARQFPR